MLKWMLGLVDGPIISRTCAAVSAGAFVFLTHDMKWNVDPGFQQALTTALTYLAYAAVHAGIVTGSAASGNAVTSSTAANAHTGD